MSMEKGPTLSRVIEQVIAELDGPVALDEVVRRILERRLSKAKNPRAQILTALRWEHNGRDMVFLDAKMVVPLHVAMLAVRFRIPLERSEVKHGVVAVEPGFTPFLARPAEEAELRDANDKVLPTRLTTVRATIKRLVEDEEVYVPAFELSRWLRAQGARCHDSLLVTILDWRAARFRLEYERANQRRHEEIERQNRALADLVYQVMEETYDERVRTNVAILTAYARVPSARDYPGDHWVEVLKRDKRMRWTGFEIVPADFLYPFEAMSLEPGEGAVQEQPFPPGKGRKVYRFRAAASYSSKKCIIEILGKQTLGDFDEIMRAAFRLDPVDHLSEFTRIIRRGAGKRPHEHHYGELNPFESTPAARVRIAGLSLEPGAELQYVHDFGDWNEHTLIVENIGEAETGVEYPRTIPVAARRGRK